MQFGLPKSIYCSFPAPQAFEAHVQDRMQNPKPLTWLSAASKPYLIITRRVAHCD